MSDIQLFDFNGAAVRITDQDGNPWFVFTDLCRILGYANPSDVKKSIREKYRASISLAPSAQDVIIVNEAGMNQLIMRSRKPEAEKLQDWVYEEVLPSIRKTGQYALIAQPAIPQRTVDEDLALIQRGMAIIDQLGCLDVDTRAQFSERVKNLILGTTPSEETAWQTVAEMVEHLGYALSASQARSLLPRLGGQVASAYRQKYGQDPEEILVYVNGRRTGVKTYAAQDWEWIAPMIHGVCPSLVSGSPS